MTIIFKYRKSFLVILLLYILWIVRHYESYHSELDKIDEE